MIVAVVFLRSKAGVVVIFMIAQSFIRVAITATTAARSPVIALARRTHVCLACSEWDFIDLKLFG